RPRSASTPSTQACAVAIRRSHNAPHWAVRPGKRCLIGQCISSTAQDRDAASDRTTPFQWAVRRRYDRYRGRRRHGDGQLALCLKRRLIKLLQQIEQCAHAAFATGQDEMTYLVGQVQSAARGAQLQGTEFFFVGEQAHLEYQRH
nr:hypothetical protein [Tanacetum cinerariifolium]